MRPELRRAWLRFAIAAAALAGAAPAFGGAQRYEDLSASVRQNLSRAVSDRGASESTDPEARAWTRATLAKVQPHFADEVAARRFLALAHYEAKRAGLDANLVLAVIDVESRFRKYAVSRAGARGLMQVMPFWVKVIGEPGHNLFHERTNLRFGCVILRHYLDRENGNLFNALGRYNGSLGKPEYPHLVLKAWKERWGGA